MLSDNTTKLTNKRSASFKKTVDSSDGKLAREQTTLQIRKQKKDEQIRRKRSQAQMMEENYDVTPVSACFPSRKASDNDIPDLATIVMKPVYSLADKVEATRRLRRLLVKERNPPLEQVIASGVLPYFVRNLAHTSSHTLVFETVWALTNIASHRTREIVAAGCVAPLVPLLGNADPNVREQAMWCLGNIAGEGAVDRDAVLALHPTPYLLRNLEVPSNMSLLQNCIWCISNLCRGDPAPDFSLTSPFVYPLAATMDRLFLTPDSDSAMNDLLWAFSYLSCGDGDETRIEIIMGTGILSRLIRLVKENKRTIQKAPIVRILGNFVYGSDNQTDSVLAAGILDCIPELIGSSSTNIRKDTCWILSNILNGTFTQAKQVFRKRDIMHSLIECATTDVWYVRQEALQALSSLFCDGTRSCLVPRFIEYGGLKPLVQCLEVSSIDLSLMKKVLDTIEIILRQGLTISSSGYGYILEEYGGVDLIENLQEHANVEIYEMAVRILENCLGAEEEDENLAPEKNEANGSFTFGFVSPKQLFGNEGAPFSFNR